LIAELASLCLAAVFLVGALTKLADPERSRASILAFGVPRAAAPLTGVLIGSELAIAVALIPHVSRLAAAAGALTLLTILTVAVAANVTRGQSPECHCFGRLSHGPIGWSTLARNGLLISLAGYVAAGRDQPGWFAGLAVVCLAAWVTLGPLRTRTGRRGAAPDFALAAVTGEPWTLDRMVSQGRPVVLVFSQPGCGACQVLMGDLEDWSVRLSDQVTLAVVSPLDRSGVGHPDPGQPTLLTLVDPGAAAASVYGVTATPSAVLIGRDGRRAGPLALGAGEITELINAHTAPAEQPRFARRTVIARAARGAAAFGGLPLIAAACGSSKSGSRTGSSSTAASTTSSSRPTALRVGDAYICRDKYALCTNAACTPSPHDPNTVICDCVVETGYSVGLKPCPSRVPDGTRLHSAFSTALATSGIRAMTCGAAAPWANCLDSPCELDPKNPNKARCQCSLVKTGPSFTFGGDCKPDTCETTVWSGAHNNVGGSEVAAALKRLGQPLVIPPPCPKA
jgi:uncharacterized membrane protein YphA (DoxX/SURF4 family)